MLRATDEVMPLIYALAAARDEKKGAESRVKELEIKVQEIIGANDGIICEGGKITWKKIDKKEYTVKATSYRQMRCSGKIFKAED